MGLEIYRAACTPSTLPHRWWRDFPGGPLVMTLCFCCRGPRFYPRLGNWVTTSCVVGPKTERVMNMMMVMRTIRCLLYAQLVMSDFLASCHLVLNHHLTQKILSSLVYRKVNWGSHFSCSQMPKSKRQSLDSVAGFWPHSWLILAPRSPASELV